MKKKTAASSRKRAAKDQDRADRSQAKNESDRKHTVIELRGRQAELLTQARRGELDVSDWDTEELMRGYRRAKNGKFAGRPPNIVPREVHEELAKRVRTKVAHELLGIAQEHIGPVIKRIMEAGDQGIAPEEVPGLKLQAQVAQDLMDRFIVSKNEKLEITGNVKHEQVIDSVTIDRSLDDDDMDIVDAEVVDIDEELDDWED